MDTTLTIDLDKTIYDKNPKLYKMMPRFVINYLKRIVHQDEVNEILTLYGVDFSGLTFNRKVLEHLNVNYQTVDSQNLPSPDGRYIFVSNHPLGALDGIVLMDFIGENYGNIKFVVNDILMYLKPLRELFVPVNKFGRQSAQYAEQIEDLYVSDKQVLYFPAGLCSRKIKGKITDLAWKKSFVTKAIQYKRDIVPLFFEGRNSNFFYNLANFRKFLGIKAGIEMLYLSDEFFRQKNANFKISIGEKIPYQHLAEIGVKQSIEYVRNKVYSITERGKR